MEYIFGTRGAAEILRTKGASHTDLTGFRQVERVYPDQTITDSFRVVCKLDSAEDQAGSCYDWYEIDRHYRTVDKSGPVSRRVDELAQAAAAAVAFVLMAEAGQIDEATAGERCALFAPWASGTAYTPGQLRRWEGVLYKCLQAHTAQEGWGPEDAPALWKLVYDPAAEWPVWSQPICAADAYGEGDKVSHKGKWWTSDLNGNVWEPGVYGWTQFTQDD